MRYLFQALKARFLDWLASIWTKVRTRNTGDR
jgi:hypothetical protein